MPEPIESNAQSLDLSARILQTTTVVASPVDATETIIASLTIPGNIAVVSGVRVFGWAALTVGTNGVSANVRIRKATVGGTIVAATGATTTVAANLIVREVVGRDTAAALPGQVYVLTLEVGSASAGSTVSAVSMSAFVV